MQKAGGSNPPHSRAFLVFFRTAGVLLVGGLLKNPFGIQFTFLLLDFHQLGIPYQKNGPDPIKGAKFLSMADEFYIRY
jgi:O-antigen ligase